MVLDIQYLFGTLLALLIGFISWFVHFLLGKHKDHETKLEQHQNQLIDLTTTVTTLTEIYKRQESFFERVITQLTGIK